MVSVYDPSPVRVRVVARVPAQGVRMDRSPMAGVVGRHSADCT